MVLPRKRFTLLLGLLVITRALSGMCLTPHPDCAMDSSDPAESEFAQWYEKERSYDEIVDKIEDWVDKYPDWVEVWDARVPVGTSDDEIATTYDGNNIKVVRIGKNIGVHGKPAAFIIGGVHAREAVAHMSAMYTLDRMLFELEQNNIEIWQLIEHTEVFAIPVINPDGYVHVKKKNLPNYVMYIPGNNYTWDIDGRFWRKNRRVTDGEWTDLGIGIDPGQPDPDTNCRGVDINRNWDFGRNTASDWEKNPCSDGYIGAVAEQEVETRAIKYLLDT